MYYLQIHIRYSLSRQFVDSLNCIEKNHHHRYWCRYRGHSNNHIDRSSKYIYT